MKSPTEASAPDAPSVQTIGRRLRLARGDTSPTWVAAQLGLSVDTLQRYEAGTSTKGPSALLIYEVAHLTNRPFEWFLDPSEPEVAA